MRIRTIAKWFTICVLLLLFWRHVRTIDFDELKSRAIEVFAVGFCGVLFFNMVTNGRSSSVPRITLFFLVHMLIKDALNGLVQACARALINTFSDRDFYVMQQHSSWGWYLLLEAFNPQSYYLVRGNPECQFFDLALRLADDTVINSDPLLLPYQLLVIESPNGIIRSWDKIPFQDQQAPLDRDGYIFFVGKVFELLRRIYLGGHDGSKRRVREALVYAQMVAVDRQYDLDAHARRPNNDQRKRRRHQEIHELWKREIERLKDTVAFD